MVFRPRSAVKVAGVDLKTRVLGMDLALPFLLAPVGSCRLFYPRGEAVASRAAGAAGTAYVLSTLSGTRLEEVKAATPGPCLYQVYLCGGHDVAKKAIARAKAAGFKALVVTIDTPVAGLRGRTCNGTKELLTRNPSRCSRTSGGSWRGRAAGVVPRRRRADELRTSAARHECRTRRGRGAEQSVMVGRLSGREAWGGPIVVKGVHTATLQGGRGGANAVGVSITAGGSRL